MRGTAYSVDQRLSARACFVRALCTALRRLLSPVRPRRRSLRSALPLFCAALLCAGCPSLSLVETAKLPFKGHVDSNLVLTEAEPNDARLYMIWESGKTARSDIASVAWVGPERFDFFGGPATILHQRRVNDLFPVVVAWVGAGNAIHITSGNSYRRLSSPGFRLSETTDYWPELLGYRDKRYLLWWDRTRLRIGEYQGQGVLASKQTVFTRQASGVQGAFQPSVAVKNNEVFVLTQLGGLSRGANFVHLARSTNLSNWSHSFIRLERSIAPRPVIVSYGEKLYIFYAGIVPNNTIRYLSSDDGTAWSPEYQLLIDTAIDPDGLAGTSGGIGVARHSGRLAVVWTTDINSRDPDDIYISVYRQR